MSTVPPDSGVPRSSRSGGADGARLFVAVWPPARIVGALADVPVGEGRRTAPERLHVTLRFVGAVGEDARRQLVAALAPAVARVPAATARLGATTATFGRHVLHVPVSGLDRLAAAVEGAVTGAGGVRPDDPPFVGHLTMARSRGRSRAQDLRPAAGAPVPEVARAPWPVAEVTLVASAGGRYEVVATFATA